MATQLAPLSASVTRILSLSGFPPELKTRDIQGAFSDWENVNGGFKIKWRDDTSLLIVFSDANTAKRAYLHTLAFPPALFTSSHSTKSALIRPYDGSDAQAVIQAVNSRHGGGKSGHNSRASVSSVVNGHGRKNGSGGSVPQLAMPTSLSLQSIPAGREPSPTLPNLPTQPTLNAMISSSLSPIEPPVQHVSVTLPPQGSSAIPIVNPATGESANVGSGTPPRIGDPGKRMVGHALGIRHPGLSAASTRPGESADQAIKEVQRAMAGVTVSD